MQLRSRTSLWGHARRLRSRCSQRCDWLLPSQQLSFTTIYLYTCSSDALCTARGLFRHCCFTACGSLHSSTCIGRCGLDHAAGGKCSLFRVANDSVVHMMLLVFVIQYVHGDVHCLDFSDFAASLNAAPRLVSPLPRGVADLRMG
eukprot:gnl/TRDRNA2_/TRDRNA2_201318_c0_seq1.p1 gnl/TRDRNA2_/TRDRNA2_201318_c0~~gnl/TRDRNA2_/TRDRNA2_201318_c0_seq1.p1  ORF type:complete len:145 (-),score=12.13 gnl/TRDRNA2_/TRDRNA2_201318_c0_seq1:188-622(-)